MEHHRCVDAHERVCVDHADLAAAALLGQGAQDDDRALGWLERLLQRHPDRQTGDRDQVMSTGMPDSGQCVVFAHDGNSWFATSNHRSEAGVHSVGPTIHLEATILKKAG